MTAPPDPGAAWTLAMRRGDFPAAWAISDAVLATAGPSDDPALPYHLRHVWDGRPLDGRRVLVRCYHGLGDTVQFARYLAPLRRRVRALALEAQPELVTLLRELSAADVVHPFDPAHPLPPDEACIEIMELAHALRLPPPPPPYLPSAPVRPGDRLRVGLCWAAGAWLPERSVPRGLLEPALALPGIELVSLQHAPADSTDVLTTAQRLAGTDLVVTVDTLVAHLAAALGRPTWLLLKDDPDWRWGKGRSPWYAAVRQFRQTAPGDWSGPVAALRAALAAHLDLPGNQAARQGL